MTEVKERLNQSQSQIKPAIGEGVVELPNTDEVNEARGVAIIQIAVEQIRGVAKCYAVNMANQTGVSLKDAAPSFATKI
ncbi:MAG TPA: hypothetical protein PKD37_06410 [Oligoflexia bacterium]|nr:hypothetical protein [Oligoflexia bacterium]HMP27593.1 hypothetical protein [Oligoflexia bacterium]